MMKSAHIVTILAASLATISTTMADPATSANTQAITLPADAGDRGRMMVHAVDAGDVELVKKLISMDSTIANQLGGGGREPLLAAVNSGNKEIASILIAAGADVNKPDGSGNLPLDGAVQSGQVDLIKLLLDKGADINRNNSSGMPPLFVAISRGQLDAVQLLVDRGANVKATANGQSAIDCALSANMNQLAMIDYLKSKGAPASTSTDVRALADKILSGDIWSTDTSSLSGLLDRIQDIDAPNAQGLTLLYEAAEKGDLSATEALINHGAKVNVRMSDGSTTLFPAVESGNRRLVDLLLGHQADPNVLNDRGESCLTLLVRGSYLPKSLIVSRGRMRMRDGTGGSEGGDADIINELLEHGARGDSPDIFGLSPLQYVLLNRDKVALVLLSPRASTAPYTAFLVAVASDQASKVASQLKAHPAWATYRLPSGATALHVAATWGAPSSITTLLKAGAEVNGRDAFGQTPLALASRVKGNSAAERILLSHRADVSVRDWRDSTPLHAAVAAEDLDAVRLLIAAKADVNAHSASIEPPLTTAMRDTGKEIAVALLEAGADPNAAGPDQSTPLMGAIRANNADLVRLLIAKKANVNATTSREGRSPLWTAVEQRNTQIVRLLLDAGANTGSAPNFGMSISQMAKNMGSPEIAAMIDAKQAQTTGGGSTKQ